MPESKIAFGSLVITPNISQKAYSIKKQDGRGRTTELHNQNSTSDMKALALWHYGFDCSIQPHPPFWYRKHPLQSLRLL